MRLKQRFVNHVIFGSVLLLGQVIHARPNYVNRIPTSFSCSTCHINPGGGGARTVFGNAYRNNRQWDQLCPLDSDGDSFTNGEELNDPDCEWGLGDPVDFNDQTRPWDDTDFPEMVIEPIPDAAVEPPVEDAAVEPPVDDAGVEPPVDDAAVEPPVEDAAVDPPVEDAAVDPPVEDAAVEPPVEDAAVDPPVEDAAVEPPVEDAEVEPMPVADMGVEPIESDMDPLDDAGAGGAGAEGGAGGMGGAGAEGGAGGMGGSPVSGDSGVVESDMQVENSGSGGGGCQSSPAEGPYSGLMLLLGLAALRRGRRRCVRSQVR